MNESLTGHNEGMDFIPFMCFGMMGFIITLAISDIIIGRKK